MRRNVFLLAVILAFGSAAFAEDFPKVEVAVDYSYARFSPSHAYISDSFSLNGGGGSVDYNLTKYIGLKGDFQGYGSNTKNFSIPAGVGPCPAGGSPCTGNIQGNLFTYQFGPQVGIRTGKFRPFGHLLFGGAHSNGGANLYKAEGSVGTRPSNNAFAMAFGGGLDIAINHSGSIAFRPGEFDYLWTNFNLGSRFKQTGQSNFQYKAGIVFSF
jgi:hypothetical protein